MSIKGLKQSGDTIVEVMIVLAVLGLAISISYATANRSLLQAREAQENTVAVELLQAQLEGLRTLDPSALSALPAVAFCLDPTTNAVATGAGCQQGPNGLYQIEIDKCSVSGAGICPTHTSDDTYYFSSTWDNVRGEGKDTVSLTYRLHS